MKIKPKKSLGQNFLIDKNIIKSIVNVGDVKKNNVILEVGPGTGNLTKDILINKPKELIVIEKDSNLSIRLEEKFKNNHGKLTINQSEKLNNSLLTIYGTSRDKKKLIEEIKLDQSEVLILRI